MGGGVSKGLPVFLSVSGEREAANWMGTAEEPLVDSICLFAMPGVSAFGVFSMAHYVIARLRRTKACVAYGPRSFRCARSLIALPRHHARHTRHTTGPSIASPLCEESGNCPSHKTKGNHLHYKRHASKGRPQLAQHAPSLRLAT